MLWTATRADVSPNLTAAGLDSSSVDDHDRKIALEVDGLQLSTALCTCASQQKRLLSSVLPLNQVCSVGRYNDCSAAHICVKACQSGSISHGNAFT